MSIRPDTVTPDEYAHYQEHVLTPTECARCWDVREQILADGARTVGFSYQPRPYPLKLQEEARRD